MMDFAMVIQHLLKPTIRFPTARKLSSPKPVPMASIRLSAVVFWPGTISFFAARLVDTWKRHGVYGA
ncbi:unnamed protein product [Echinostoma caproni]|uniref:Secreted protein n=1 Tax=Echinostoma caproni TaxID=27848 RepID=A0A183A2B2_9TREM|nr:unnamed protein product [Echinostoma caproni]